MGREARQGAIGLVIDGDYPEIPFPLDLDPARGGTIRGLIAKSLGGREFVDSAHERRFKELRGHFYDKGGFHSSADQPAKVRIIESGPLRATAEIAGHPFVQRVSITQASPLIEGSVRIDWHGNPHIGESAQGTRP